MPPIRIETAKVAKKAKIVPEDAPTVKKKRAYYGPPKGSDEAKERMAKVRAAQWAKNGLVISDRTAY